MNINIKKEIDRKKERYILQIERLIDIKKD